jgi:predicted O-methyltransferase YrrM
MKTFEAFKDRGHFLEILSKMNVKRGCEVGVKEGYHAKDMLSIIGSLEKLYLVDLWESQENYFDASNCSESEFDKFYKLTLKNTGEWSEKVEILRGYSNQMVHNIEDNSLDFVYIDARHDYYGCLEDIELYWNKLKIGGIMSGHDYMENDDLKLHKEMFGSDGDIQDWSISQDGRIHPGAVKGAVDDFANRHGLQVLVSYREKLYNNWCFIKQ